LLWIQILPFPCKILHDLALPSIHPDSTPVFHLARPSFLPCPHQPQDVSTFFLSIWTTLFHLLSTGNCNLIPSTGSALMLFLLGSHPRPFSWGHLAWLSLTLSRVMHVCLNKFLSH
jgi:hypothetical protein